MRIKRLVDDDAIVEGFVEVAAPIMPLLGVMIDGFEAEEEEEEEEIPRVGFEEEEEWEEEWWMAKPLCTTAVV